MAKSSLKGRHSCSEKHTLFSFTASALGILGTLKVKRAHSLFSSKPPTKLGTKISYLSVDNREIACSSGLITIFYTRVTAIAVSLCFGIQKESIVSNVYFMVCEFSLNWKLIIK